MEDTRMEIRVYNKTLYDLIFAMFKSISEFSHTVGVHQTTIGDFLNIRKKRPFKKNGEYCKMAIRVAEFFQIDVYVLFPKSLYKVEGTGVVVLEFDSQMIACTERNQYRDYLPDTRLLDEGVRLGLQEAMNELNTREHTVITMRILENKTLEECGEELGVTRERARQIEDKAFKKLRQPKVIKKLEELR